MSRIITVFNQALGVAKTTLIQNLGYHIAQMGHRDRVLLIVRELDNNAASQLALIENLLREDLNPVEETEGILQLLMSMKRCCEKFHLRAIIFKW